MKELTLTPDQTALVTDTPVTVPLPRPEEEVLMALPLVEAKRLIASAFERRYLVHLMERAGGSVSEGARLSGLDRTNFRRLLQRHGLRPLKGPLPC